MFKTILISSIAIFLAIFSANSQWKVINSTIGADIKALVKVNNGLMVATDGKGIYYSANNENNWMQKNAGLINLKVYSIDVDGNKVVAGTGGSGVLISTNGGNNWANTGSGITVPYVYAVGLFGSNIVAGTGGGGIFLSNDDGKSWKANGGTTQIVNAITRFNGYAYMGQGPYAYKSTDNGQSWQSYIPQSNTTIKAFAESSKQGGGKNVIVGTLDGIFVSTDDGKSWKNLQKGNCTGLTSFGNVVFASFENTYSEVATAYTLDNGLTWKFSDEGLPKQINVRAITSDKEYVYIGTGDGVVWKRKLTDFGITSVGNKSEINRFEIFPNPASEYIEIRQPEENINFAGNFDLKILNTNGESVMAIKANLAQSLKRIDISHLPVGVYFIQFGEYVGKLIVVK